MISKVNFIFRKSFLLKRLFCFFKEFILFFRKIRLTPPPPHFKKSFFFKWISNRTLLNKLSNKGSSLALMMGFMGISSLVALGAMSSLYEGMDAADLVQIRGAINSLEMKLQTNDWSGSVEGSGCDFLGGGSVFQHIPVSNDPVVFISQGQPSNAMKLDNNLL